MLLNYHFVAQIAPGVFMRKRYRVNASRKILYIILHSVYNNIGIYHDTVRGARQSSTAFSLRANNIISYYYYYSRLPACISVS